MSVFSGYHLEEFLQKELKLEKDVDYYDILEWGWEAKDGNWFELEISKRLELENVLKIKKYLKIDNLYFQPSSCKNYTFSIIWNII